MSFKMTFSTTSIRYPRNPFQIFKITYKYRVIQWECQISLNNNTKWLSSKSKSYTIIMHFPMQWGCYLVITCEQSKILITNESGLGISTTGSFYMYLILQVMYLWHNISINRAIILHEPPGLVVKFMTILKYCDEYHFSIPWVHSRVFSLLRGLISHHQITLHTILIT